MPKINFSCNQCNNLVEMSIGQTIRNHTIRWYGSYICSNCGNAEEQDDTGLPSGEIRTAILEEQGGYEIYTDEIKLKAKLLKVLKQHLNIPLPGLTTVLAKIPGVFMEGTKVEMQWLQQLLIVENVKTNVVKSKSVDL